MLISWSQETTLRILMLSPVIVSNWLKKKKDWQSFILIGQPFRNEVESCPVFENSGYRQI